MLVEGMDGTHFYFVELKPLKFELKVKQWDFVKNLLVRIIQFAVKQIFHMITVACMWIIQRMNLFLLIN